MDQNSKALYQEALKSGPMKKKHLTAFEALLLEKDIHITNSPTIQVMLKGWSKHVQWIKFNGNHTALLD